MDPQTQAFYDGDPEGYSESTIRNDVSEIMGRFVARLRPGSRVLDLGCGSGRDTLTLRRLGFDVVPADGSEGMCRVAGRNTGSDVLRLDIADMDFEGEFDGVWACASLLHLLPGEVVPALEGIRRALRPGGAAYVSFKEGTFSGMRDGRWYTDMTSDAVADAAAAAGFSSWDIWASADGRGTRWTNAILDRRRAASVPRRRCEASPLRF